MRLAGAKCLLAVGGCGDEECSVALATGGTEGSRAASDILLVFLIIFMAIAPVSPAALEAICAVAMRSDGSQNPNTSIVLQILRTDTDQPRTVSTRPMYLSLTNTQNAVDLL